MRKAFAEMFAEINKIVVGQDEAVEQITIALLCDSNALLEGYPGLAKTLTVKTLAQIMDLKFSRIQNTPDLMPSDITGTYLIEEVNGKRQFKFQPGPIFANIVLADEINRATPKTQSALLEAMQEKQVTVGNATFQLDLPFFVLATMNPIEQEGSLALNQHVFVNGVLKTGKELLSLYGNKCIAEDEKGIKLYDAQAWTLSLNTAGKLEKRKCLLYTLPYADEFAVITTKTGRKISVTKNHPFLVNDNGIILWKKAGDLTKQDYLVNPARLPSEMTHQFMTHHAAVSRMTQKSIPREIEIDADFAFWAAFILSDGSIGEKCVEVVQKNYPQALDRFVKISERYGLKITVSLNRGCRYARIYSKGLVEYLKIRFGMESGKKKSIPSTFLRFSGDMNREFLKTFIALESSLRDNRIVFTQKNEQDVNIISYMLLREGIISWIRHDGRIFRMKIQGKDLIKYIGQIGWISMEKEKLINLDRTVTSSWRVIPVSRMSVLRLVELLGMNSFHTLKGRKSITSRNWYSSYRGIKEGEVVMSVDSLGKMVKDIRMEIGVRRNPSFIGQLDSNPRFFSASIGLPMTQMCSELSISRNQVSRLYTNGKATHMVKMKQYMLQQHEARLTEAEKLLTYFEALLSEDVFYDKIKSIDFVASEEMAFGLTVPELQNYIGGFGGCGINHNTYPLPEAQADRFLLKIKLDYPSAKEELEIVNRYAFDTKIIKPKIVLSKSQLIALQSLTKQVPIANDIKERAVKIILATRTNKDLIAYGASPRASIGLILAAKARALIMGRNHVSSEDIDAMALPILRHRIILNFEAERKGLTPDDAIKQLLAKVK